MKKHSDTLKNLASCFMSESVKTDYSYNFEWLSRPIIQYPQDIVATQELIWKVKPDLIIETGIAHGGSLILSASILALLEYNDASKNGTFLDPQKPKRKVIGVDIDIRKHNLDALNKHSMRNRLELIEGSSIDPKIISKVYEISKKYNRIMVFLDSNHTHIHVLEELKAYANLVTPGSYCIVFDTVIDDLSDISTNNRPWGVGNSPKTAVCEFIETNSDFVIDLSIQNKLLITVAPNGYLKRN